MNESQKKELVIQKMLEVEYLPTLDEEDVDPKKFRKIPWAELCAIGSAFASMSETFRTVVHTAPAEGLFQRVDSLGLGLAPAKGHPGLFRGVAQNGATLHGGTLFKPVDSVSTTTPLPYDPSTLLMAATLVCISYKLDTIEKTQLEILDYLKQQDRAKIRGDLNLLLDTMQNYKFNWNNEMYKANQHMKILDIKQDAEQAILLQDRQISASLEKHARIVSDQSVQKKQQEFRTHLADYQTALYVYAFSSFLEVMLLGNFQSEYLTGVSQKIQDHAFRYRVLYTNCYNQLEKESQSSLQNHLRNGTAHLVKGAGNVIAKIPVISKSQIDENLIGVGKWMEKENLEHSEQSMKQFSSRKSHVVQPFLENLHAVDVLFNQPMELLFDEDHIYLPIPENA